MSAERAGTCSAAFETPVAAAAALGASAAPASACGAARNDEAALSALPDADATVLRSFVRLMRWQHAARAALAAASAAPAVPKAPPQPPHTFDPPCCACQQTCHLAFVASGASAAGGGGSIACLACARERLAPAALTKALVCCRHDILTLERFARYDNTSTTTAESSRHASFVMRVPGRRLLRRSCAGIVLRFAFCVDSNVASLNECCCTWAFTRLPCL